MFLLPVIFLTLYIDTDASFLCPECSKPYTLDENTLVGACPTKYTQNNFSCDFPGDATLFDIDFGSFTTFETGQINSFFTPSGTFHTSSNPFPTIDRGFYFQKNSYLTTVNSMIPSPLTSLDIWVRILTKGYIFQVNGVTPYYRIWGKESIHLDLRYCGDNNACDIKNSVNEFTEQDSATILWKYICVDIDTYSSDTMRNILYLNYFTKSSINFIGENAISVEPNTEKYTWIIGDSNYGFEGFIYRMKVSQIINPDFFEFDNPPLCNPFHYYSEGSCLACSECGITGMWCVRPSDCSSCSSNYCSACTGFSELECDSWTNECQKGCLSCSSYFDCDLCEFGYMRAEYEWGKDCVEVLEFNMLGFKVSSFVVSGANPSTDYLNSEDTDNPKPVPGRGFYFDGDDFLRTRGEFLIPYSFFIYIWVLPTSGTIIKKGTGLSILTDLFSFRVTNDKNNFISHDLQFTIIKTNWNYLSFEVIYNEGTQNSKFTVNKDIYYIESGNGYFYLDFPSQSLIIGEAYTGFIAIIGIASKIHYPDSYTSGYMSEITSVYGSTLNNCSSIDAQNCTLSCNPCDICKDAINQECFQCPFGYFTSDSDCEVLIDNPGSIIIGGFEYLDEGLCLFSALGLGCTSCNYKQLYKSICVSECPLGYTSISGICTLSGSLSFVQDFNNMLKTSSTSNILFGNNNFNDYPTIDIYDPWPTYKRGYYFTSFSYISINNLIIGPEAYIGLWVKIDSPGKIMKKFSPIYNNFDIYSIYNLYINIYSKYSYFEIEGSGSDAWVYLSFSFWFDESAYLTKFYYFTNNQLIHVEVLEYDYINDEASELIVGSWEDNGFTGFLYKLEIYSQSYPDFDFYSLDCGKSPLSDACIDTCSIFKFYDLGLDSCNYCDLSCTYGCLRSVDCILCANELCATCLKVDSVNCLTCRAGLNQDEFGNCSCPTGSFFSSNTLTCLSCAMNCDECSGELITECLTCSTGFKYFPLYLDCLEADTCPGVNEDNLNSCEVTKSLLVSYEFPSFLSYFADTTSFLYFGTADISTSYPEYTEKTPWVVPGRGFYFKDNSYLLFDDKNKLVFGPEFTIGIWARCETPGVLLMRSDTSTIFILQIIVSEDSSLVFTGTLRDAYSSYSLDKIPYTAGLWGYFSFTVARQGVGRRNSVIESPIISLYTMVNGFKDSTLYKSTYIGLFTGFVRSIEIYNYVYQLQVNGDGGPFDIVGTLSLCSIFEYPNDCLPCPERCLYGCRQNETCSMCDDPLCEKCTSHSACTECYGTALLTDGVCTCKSGFNYTSLTCLEVFDCHETCLSCDGDTLKDCLKCSESLYKVNGYCINCPSGSWNNETGTCELFSGLVFFTNFSTLSGILFDTIGDVPIITGNSQNFYPNYDDEDPFSAYLRGFYFDGVQSVVRLPEYKDWITPKLVLGPTWSIEFWINTQESAGCFFSQRSSRGRLISICFDSINIKVLLRSKEYLAYSFQLTKSLNGWKLIKVSFLSGPKFTLSLNIDDTLLSSTNGDEYLVPNYYPASYFEIGKSGDIYFKGFIYQISVLSTTETLNLRLLTTLCDYQLNGECFVDCPFDEYWEGPLYNDCSKCHSTCKNGCRRKDSCSLCSDPLCYKCTDFISDTCNQCTSLSEYFLSCTCNEGTVLDYSVYECKVCGSNQFYNSVTCKDCSKLCAKCVDSKSCIECIENAYKDNGACQCNLGYNGTETCESAFFSAVLLINQKNDAYIQFQDPLKSEFTSNFISLTASNIGIDSYQIEQFSASIYKLSITFNKEVPDDAKLSVLFKKPLYSVYNSILETEYLESDLYSDGKISEIQKTAESKTTSETVTTAATSTSIAVSMANPNPACLWNFINTIQMLCFISLSSIPLSPKFAGYLKGLKKYNMFPNIFAYFVPHQGGNKPFDRAYEYGYKDHLIIFNIGNYISAFLSMIAIWIIVYILSKLTSYKPFSYNLIKNKIKSTLDNYKYSAFIRFWITCYLDVIASALIGVLTTESFYWVEVVNFFVCCMLIILVVITPVLFMYKTLMKKNQISKENTELQANWGTLFYEFNNDKGLGSSQFYFYFFIRRILYMVIQFFLQDVPIIQLSLNITLSGCFLVYLCIFRPFNEFILNVSNILSELCITLIFCFAAINLLRIPSGFRLAIDDLLVALLNVVMGTNMLASILVLIKTIILIIKQKRENKNRVVPVDIKNDEDPDQKRITTNSKL